MSNLYHDEEIAELKTKYARARAVLEKVNKVIITEYPKSKTTDEHLDTLLFLNGVLKKALAADAPCGVVLDQTEVKLILPLLSKVLDVAFTGSRLHVLVQKLKEATGGEG